MFIFSFGAMRMQNITKLVKILCALLIAVAVILFLLLLSVKVYQQLDDDPGRGALAINSSGGPGNEYMKTFYLDQGWDASDSLWFYNTTQGSGLIPYDFFIALEQVSSTVLFRADGNMDKYRYLPQKPTFFNPDGLAVGFVKDTYRGKSYVGYTCAACHTGQVNYQGAAIRIDGAPAMADMVGFLEDMEKAMSVTLKDESKLERFVDRVKKGDDFSDAEEIKEELEQWVGIIKAYNTINHSEVDYGYARLDAFGRIYNRVLQHVINKKQLGTVLGNIRQENNEHLLSKEQISLVLEGVSDTVIGSREFSLVIIKRLASDAAGYPGLNLEQILTIRDAIFNETNAPTSYPSLWDTPRFDYLQWNGLAANAGLGGLGRNVGQAIGVFGILDWRVDRDFSLGAFVTGQHDKTRVAFDSSINTFNLARLEHQIKRLRSPKWPENILGEIDKEKADKGQLIYAKHCQSCHQVVDKNERGRILVNQMFALTNIGTDKKMAENSVNYAGFSGNFAGTYQTTEVGPLVIQERAPVIQLLTSATRGVIATPDPDKTFIRRWAEQLYAFAMTLLDNPVKPSIKTGDYMPDTTSAPYSSLLSYKAGPLNGIWATAPYLHNGSVPTLYDMLLPQEERPKKFTVGTREFDPVKVGFKKDEEGSVLDTSIAGNYNTGHEWRSQQRNGSVLPPLTPAERWALIEYLKTL